MSSTEEKPENKEVLRETKEEYVEKEERSEGAGRSDEAANEPPRKRIPVVDQKNRMDLICHYFTHGNSIPKIVEILERDYQCTELTREGPYADIAAAAKQGLLKYHPPKVFGWDTELSDRYPFIMEAQIPGWGGRMAVISEAAEMVARNIYFIAKSIAFEYGKEWRFPCEMRPSPEPRRTRKHWPSSHDQDAWWEEDHPDPTNGTDPKPVPLVLEVRIGFSGGSTMGLTAHDLGRVLEPKLEEWEKKLKDKVFESMEKAGRGDEIPKGILKRRFKVELKLLFVNLVPGFDTDPLNHPIAFLTSMINSNEELASRAELMCFSVAPFININEKKDFYKELYGPNKVKAFVDKWGLDIVITSAGGLYDEHSTLRNYFRGGKGPGEESEEARAREAFEILKRHGVEGDFLWQPIKTGSPFSYDDLDAKEKEKLKFRPMTLLTLGELADLRDSKHDIVLVVAPCAFCQEPKDRILRAILSQERAIVSHLATDRESIAPILDVEDRGD